MGGHAEALSALYYEEIRPKRADPAVTLGWLVCLSECRHGDRRPVLLVKHTQVL